MYFLCSRIYRLSKNQYSKSFTGQAVNLKKRKKEIINPWKVNDSWLNRCNHSIQILSSVHTISVCTSPVPLGLRSLKMRLSTVKPAFLMSCMYLSKSCEGTINIPTVSTLPHPAALAGVVTGDLMFLTVMVPFINAPLVAHRLIDVGSGSVERV